LLYPGAARLFDRLQLAVFPRASSGCTGINVYFVCVTLLHPISFFHSIAFPYPYTNPHSISHIYTNPDDNSHPYDH
jgi:hypothetical protein